MRTCASVRVLALFLGAASAAYALEAAAAESIGEVVASAGSPTAEGPGGNRSLGAGSQVFQDDRIVTRADANAQIIFVDGTRLVVGPRSTVVIDEFLLRSPDRAKAVSLDALRGTFRFITGRSAKSAFKIQTANATIGIRGTGFDFSSRNNTTLAVHEGSTELCTGGGSCVNVDSGCEVGRAGGNTSELLTGSSKSLAIQNNLPYIIDQSPLAAPFRLNVAACGRISPRPRSGTEPGQRGNNPAGGSGGGCGGQDCGGGDDGGGGNYGGD